MIRRTCLSLVVACLLASPAFGVVTFQDTFTDTATTQLSAHDPDIDLSGLGWTDPGDRFAIDSSNRANPLTNNDSYAYFEGGSADGTYTIVFDPDDTSLPTFWAIVRRTDDDNLISIRGRPSDGQVYIFVHTTAGGVVEQDSGTIAGYTAGDPITMEITLSGTSITADFNSGAESLSATSSVNQTEETHGFFTTDTDHTIDEMSFDDGTSPGGSSMPIFMHHYRQLMQ